MGYAYQATVTVPAPTGGPHANFTFLLKGSNALLKLASLGTGGAIQNSTTRSYTGYNQTVPADLVLSTDAGITSLMSWGIDNWDSANGVVWIWVKITSYSAGFTIYVSIGNSLVTTYQGGSIGSEFDSSTLGAWHLNDNAANSIVTDFTVNANDLSYNGANTSARTVPGIIGSGLSFTGGTDYASNGSISRTTQTAFTMEGWVQFPSNPGFGTTETVFSMGNGTTNAPSMTLRYLNPWQMKLHQVLSGDIAAASAAGWTTSAWHHIVITVSAGSPYTYGLYFDGAQLSTGSSSSTLATASSFYMAAQFYSSAPQMPLIGNLDESRYSNTDRSAAWIATEYANQSNPPSIGAFSPLSTGSAPSLTLLGCQ